MHPIRVVDDVEDPRPSTPGAQLDLVIRQNLRLLIAADRIPGCIRLLERPSSAPPEVLAAVRESACYRGSWSGMAFGDAVTLSDVPWGGGGEASAVARTAFLDHHSDHH
jgi:hypothetical protein